MATWQAAQPGTVIGDGQGNYQIRVNGQWQLMPKGSLTADEHGAYHFDSDVIHTAAPKTPAANAAAAAAKPDPNANAAVGGAETTEGPLGFANGVAELVGKGLGNMPMAAVHGVADIVSRATGQGGRPAAPPTFPLSKNAERVGSSIGSTLAPQHAPDVEDQTQAIRQQAVPGEGIGNEYVAPVAGDVANALPLAGPLGRVGGAIDAAVAERGAAALPAETNLGMRTGAENPIARNVAGSSAQPAVAAHNQAIADPALGAQAGVAPGTPLTPKALEDARAAPNSVYQRLEASLPTAPLSPAAVAKLPAAEGTDMVVHSPDVRAQISAQRERLTAAPLTGSEVVNGTKALRFNGFQNIASEDPERIALGRAQLQMSDALHQHVADTLPANAPVTLDQLSAARQALAQNHTVSNFLKGGNIDLQKLAKMHRDNPGLLTGPMADIADFADRHPEVTSLPSNEERFNPSGVTKDIAAVDLKSPATYLQPFFGAAARRRLTGAARAPNVPVTGLGGEFGPPVPQELSLQPPPGTALEPHQPQLATGNPQQQLPLGTGGMTASPPSAPPAPAAGPPGQIPLADLLSHGVEQPLAEGLSLAPNAPSVPEGIPFARNAAHEAGGLTLDEMLQGPRTYGGAPSELPAVMSQGVPEGTVARAPQPNPPRPGVAHSPAMLTNNASLGNPASIEGISAKNEALAKGVKPVSFGADDQAHPMSVHDIERRDLNPAPDSIFIDAKTGKIINSGRMAPRAAQALLARWRALHGAGGALGEAF